MNRKKTAPKVAIVADWITNPGGDDKVLRALCNLFPAAPLYTTIYKQEDMPHYKNRHIRTTWLNKILLPHQVLVPLMFNALRRFDFSSFDLIISSSHTVGKSITKPARTKHICYCHTPLRYVWAPEIDPLKSRINLGPLEAPLLSLLKKYDIRSSKTVDQYVANSHYIAKRIKRAYGAAATVVYPPVETALFTPREKVSKGDYFLAAGRLISYKKNDLIIKACNKANVKLVVAGTGPELNRLKAIRARNVQFLGYVSDKKLIELYQQAKGIIFAAHEDFGIVPVEAQASGTPVVAYGAGGAKETVIDGKTGLLFPEQTVSSLAKTLVQFEKQKFSSRACIANAQRFDKKNFDKQFRQLINDVLSEEKK